MKPLTVLVMAAIALIALSGWPGLTVAQYGYTQIYLPAVMSAGTPTPFGFPTATPTRTPTLTPVPGSAIVLPNDSFYYSGGSYLYVVGEVQNNGARDLTSVKVIADFYNAANQMVGNAYNYVSLDRLQSGDKTCFAVLLSIPPGWNHYQFEAVSFSTDYLPALASLSTQSSSAYYDAYETYKVIGMVRNDASSPVQYVNVIGTLYNSSGKVIRCNHSYLNNSTLGPGETSSFTISYSSIHIGDVASYRLQTDGSPQ